MKSIALSSRNKQNIALLQVSPDRHCSSYVLFSVYNTRLNSAMEGISSYGPV